MLFFVEGWRVCCGPIENKKTAIECVAILLTLLVMKVQTLSQQSHVEFLGREEKNEATGAEGAGKEGLEL